MPVNKDNYGNFGFKDGSSTGGYETIERPDAEAKAAVDKVYCNDAAASNRSAVQPNSVGGEYAGSDGTTG